MIDGGTPSFASTGGSVHLSAARNNIVGKEICGAMKKTSQPLRLVCYEIL